MKQLTPYKKNKMFADRTGFIQPQSPGAGFTVVEVILIAIAIAIFIGVVFVAFNRAH